MDCYICGLHAHGRIDQAASLEAVRVTRLLLAQVSGAVDATGEISAELGNCHACCAWLVSTLTAQLAATFAQTLGGEEAAARALQHALLEHIDETPA